MAPNNVLVNHPFPKEDLPLASIVCNLESPNQDAYKSPDVGEGDWSVASLKDYSAFIEEDSQSLFEMAVSTFFSLVSDSKADEKVRVFAPEARRYTLLQPQSQFQNLCQNASVRQWIRHNYGRNLFFVIGYLTMTDATIVKRGSNSRQLQCNFDTNLPLSVAAEDMKTQTTTQLVQHGLDSVVYKAAGEQIFSICYRMIKFSWFTNDTNLESSNRWKLFTSNRGSSRGGRRFVEADIGKRDFIPGTSYESFEGPAETFIISRRYPQS